ncbi:MAG: endolytic transglycosylase MltG [Candidatus Saccharibacteria bacterium]
MQPNNHHQIPPHTPSPKLPEDKSAQSSKKELRKTPLWLLVLLGVFGVITAVFVAGIIWLFSTVYAVRTNVSVNGQIFEVKKGESISEIANELAQQSLIDNPNAFVLYAKLGPAHGRLIPGPYLIRPSSSIASIVGDMSSGRIAQNKITFPEGITMADMATRFANAGYGSKEEYLSAAKSLATDYSFIPASAKDNPEGYLFPSTYTFIPNRGATELVKKQYEAFNSEMVPLLQSKQVANLTPNQVLTLASIVEKEALTEKDRKLVAGVFLNRLAKGMKFESDVTVNYATGKKITSPADLSVNSPYNTYRIVGLPPTPINNPSTDSVEAVLNYTPNDYIFFIAGNDGVVYYAKTLSEHNQNIKNHL